MPRWFSPSSLPVCRPHGGLGFVELPLCATTLYVGFFFAPQGKAVLVGRP